MMAQRMNLNQCDTQIPRNEPNGPSGPNPHNGFDEPNAPNEDPKLSESNTDRTPNHINITKPDDHDQPHSSASPQ